MATFTAGQKLRASVLNDALPLLGRCTADTTRTSNTTLQDVTGMSIAVAASTAYALDGYVAYSANAGDIKIAFTVPASASGHWAFTGLDTAASNPGNLKSIHITAYGAANTSTLGGDTGLVFKGQLMGYLLTDVTAGTIQMQMAQSTSNGTASTIKAGSWFRLVKLS